MAGSIDINGALLVFKRDDVSLDDLGKAAKAYTALILALEHRIPVYAEFTEYLLKAGHVEPEKGDGHVPATGR